MLQTAERSSHLDPSENVIYQRHVIAYKEAAKIISGTVLEVGSGEGFGITELASRAEHYIAVDKYETFISKELQANNKITFIQTEVPPLKEIEDNSVDFVVSFQVIEHIKDDERFLQEIHRVLKPGGKAIITTPNIMMSITRSPWHTREYTPEQMGEILESSFDNYELKGVFGNEKVMDYYNKNKESVRKITRFDILNMQYWLPRWMLEIPYDILNRFNRQNLQDDNEEMVNTVVYTDYSISESNNECLDHFCIATK
ncbi:MAG TPA: class I SAM-dependent methyltransferase [Flavobacteriales bacterium]|nr:class I SAM-dependent methyltransferase [Flavobacteriales bacterium]HIK62609.1 class I SAM-dependent methyltransferase [Flavobacteriales bacterium]